MFVLVFAGGLLGLLLNRRLPAEHLSKETQDVVRLGTGMLSVLASLVLGLLIASGKTTFDRSDSDVRQFSGIVIQLGGALRDFGPEAALALSHLRDYTTRTVRYHWTGAEEPTEIEDPVAGNFLRQLRDDVIALPEVTSRQTMLRAQAWELFKTMQQSRWRIIEQGHNTFPPMVLWILVAWIACIFLSFGLNAPRNATVIGALLVCSAAIGCAIFLVNQLNEPFEGLIKISGEPMQTALAHISK